MKTTLCLLVVIFFTFCTSQSQSVGDLTPEQINAEFFNLYRTNGVGVSLKYIFTTNKWMNENDVKNVRNKLNELASQLGKYYTNELITKKSIGESFVLYSFLVKYERQPIRFSMTYYKADSQWQLQSFEFDYELQTELKEAAATYRLTENLPGNEK